MRSNSNLLENKIALVTGCNRGIGRAILESYASNGAIIYAATRSVNSLDDLVKKYDNMVIPVYLDVIDKSAINLVFQKIYREQKRIDILVNNAGIMKDALVGMISQDLMQEVFSTNVFSVVNMIQYASKLMIRQKSGSIINLSSIAGVYGSSGQAVYSASKGAIIALTKSVAKEFAKHNIRVNALAPGMIDTDLFHSIGDSNINNAISKIAIGRLGNPEEVADAALYLASDLSTYVTGQVIGVDGAASI